MVPASGKYIIALDAATKTGWCIITVEKKILESGVEDFTKRRGESNGLMFLRFRRWLSDLMKLCPEKPFLLAYERAHYRGGAATEICVNLTGLIQEMAAALAAECATVTTAELKRFATGKGVASKEEMIKVAEPHLNRKPLDDNEADAVMIGVWAADTYGYVA